MSMGLSSVTQPSYRVFNFSPLCLFEGKSRLQHPWQCPVDGCEFSTDVKRSRPAHLLRAHHLLFQSHGRDPVPLGGAELVERREAYRRRNRGSRQRAREARRADRGDDGGRVAAASVDEPVAGPPDDLVSLEDPDWGAAVIDLQLLLSEDVQQEEPPESVPAPVVLDPREDWLVVPWVPPPPPEVMDLPLGIPVSEFVQKVSEWRASGLTLPQTVEAALLLWRVAEGELSLLRLAIQLVAASRQVAAFNSLENVQQRLLLGFQPEDILRAVVEENAVTAAQR